MLRTAVSIPVGTANSKQKNCPNKAVFLLNTAHFSLKTGLKNSYAPRSRLSGIFVRTRDPDLALLLYKPKLVKETIMKTVYLKREDFLVQVLDKGTSYYTSPLQLPISDYGAAHFWQSLKTAS